MHTVVFFQELKHFLLRVTGAPATHPLGQSGRG
jgi:hypothetical protein